MASGRRTVAAGARCHQLDRDRVEEQPAAAWGAREPGDEGGHVEQQLHRPLGGVLPVEQEQLLVRPRPTARPAGRPAAGRPTRSTIIAATTATAEAAARPPAPPHAPPGCGRGTATPPTPPAPPPPRRPCSTSRPALPLTAPTPPAVCPIGLADGTARLSRQWRCVVTWCVVCGVWCVQEENERLLAP
jgi:hypothetical protein